MYLKKTIIEKIKRFWFSAKKKNDIENLSDDLELLSGKYMTAREMAKYPNPTAGLPAISVNHVLRDHADSIAEIEDMLGVSGDSGKKLVRDVIHNLASYIHLLPASENFHHKDMGGLIAHSIEVAMLALRTAMSYSIPKVGYPDEQPRRKATYFYAVFVSALFHDAGKVITDTLVTSLNDSNMEWNPYYNSLTDWLRQNNLDWYRAAPRARRKHNEHERAVMMILAVTLTPEAKERLFLSTENVFMAIERAIKGEGDQEEYLTKAVKVADQYSTKTDSQTVRDRFMGPREKARWQKIIDLMIFLGGKEPKNDPKGGGIKCIGTPTKEVWVSYPSFFNKIIAAAADVGYDGLPKTAKDLLKDMIMSETVYAPALGSDFSYFKAGKFTTQEFRAILRRINNRQEKLDTWEPVARIGFPAHILPNSAIPPSMEGILVLNLKLDAWLCDETGIIDTMNHEDLQSKVINNRTKTSINAVLNGDVAIDDDNGTTTVISDALTNDLSEEEEHAASIPKVEDAALAVQPITQPQKNTSSRKAPAKNKGKSNTGNANAPAKTKFKKAKPVEVFIEILKSLEDIDAYVFYEAKEESGEFDQVLLIENIASAALSEADMIYESAAACGMIEGDSSKALLTQSGAMLIEAIKLGLSTNFFIEQAKDGKSKAQQSTKNRPKPEDEGQNGDLFSQPDPNNHDALSKPTSDQAGNDKKAQPPAMGVGLTKEKARQEIEQLLANLENMNMSIPWIIGDDGYRRLSAHWLIRISGGALSLPDLIQLEEVEDTMETTPQGDRVYAYRKLDT